MKHAHLPITKSHIIVQDGSGGKPYPPMAMGVIPSMLHQLVASK